MSGVHEWAEVCMAGFQVQEYIAYAHFVLLVVAALLLLAVMALLLLFTCFEVLCVGWRRRQGCCCRCSYCCGDVVFYGGVVGCSFLIAVAHSFPYFLS